METVRDFIFLDSKLTADGDCSLDIKRLLLRLLLGEGGLQGATPRSRSGGAAMRRYPSSKVRSSGCALLEQP